MSRNESQSPSRPDPLDGLAPDHADQQEYHRDHQQHMQPAAERRGGNHPEQPQHHKLKHQKQDHAQG